MGIRKPLTVKPLKLFQFQLVRLKLHAQVSDRNFAVVFQFQLVRLKSIEIEAFQPDLIVSIPTGSIKIKNGSYYWCSFNQVSIPTGSIKIK